MFIVTTNERKPDILINLMSKTCRGAAEYESRIVILQDKFSCEYSQTTVFNGTID